jgi:hypothetical protein
LKRQKVEVKWWGGQATFLGQTPNARLLLWPKVRRVQTEEKQEVFWTALLNQGDESNRAQRRKLLKAMFIKSPLTLMVAASSQLAFEDLELNPLVSVPDPVSSESQWSPFLLWEDATLSRGVIDYWLGHEPLVAARTLTFWLLQSLNEKTASALAQKRCLEVLMYLLWSTLTIDRPQDEVKQIWTHDFWVKSPAHWPEGRLERWALIAWALEETDLAQPFYDLDPYGREIFQKLMKRLVHSEIQLRKQAMENQLAAIWTSQAP